MHELGAILYAERVLVKALPKLEKEATDPELARASRSTRPRPNSTSRTSSTRSRSSARR